MDFPNQKCVFLSLQGLRSVSWSRLRRIFATVGQRSVVMSDYYDNRKRQKIFHYLMMREQRVTVYGYVIYSSYFYTAFLTTCLGVT